MEYTIQFNDTESRTIEETAEKRGYTAQELIRFIVLASSEIRRKMPKRSFTPKPRGRIPDYSERLKNISGNHLTQWDILEILELTQPVKAGESTKVVNAMRHLGWEQVKGADGVWYGEWRR